MNDALVVITLLLVATSATAAVAARDPVRQALVLALMGLALAALFTVLQAPDVALSQLAVGSALTPLLILLSVRKIRRRAGGGASRANGSGGTGTGRAGGTHDGDGRARG